MGLGDVISHKHPKIIYYQSKEAKMQSHFISHRASGMSHPPETLLAIEEAINYGVMNIELDIRKTNDGVYIISHDNFIKDENGKMKSICESTYNEMLRACKGFPVSLEEVMKLCRKYIDSGHNMKLHLDIKCQDAIIDILDMIYHFSMSNNIVFVSWCQNNIYDIYKLSKEIPISYSFIPVPNILFGALKKSAPRLAAAVGYANIVRNNLLLSAPRSGFYFNEDYIPPSKKTKVDTISVISNIATIDVYKIVKITGGYFCIPRISARFLKKNFFDQGDEVALFSFNGMDSALGCKIKIKKLLFYMDSF